MSYTAALQHTGPLLCCRSHAELFPLQQRLLCLIRFQPYLPAPYDSITSAARQHAQMHSTGESHKSVISLSRFLPPIFSLCLFATLPSFPNTSTHSYTRLFTHSRTRTIHILQQTNVRT